MVKKLTVEIMIACFCDGKNLASAVMAPIMRITWISWISFTVHSPWFIEIVDGIMLDALLRET